MAKSEMALRDSFNRKIEYARVSVTDRCNLRCCYCMPKGMPACAKPSDLLSREEIIRFLKVANRFGLSKIRLTGGEPLLRKDIVDIVRSVKGIGIGDVSLTTNGFLLPPLALDLKKAGLNRVNISLDTMYPDRYRIITGGGSLDKVFEAIHAAEQAGLAPVKINMVPIRGINDDEILSFAGLSFDKPYHVRFIELMPVGEEAWSKKRRVTAFEVMRTISKMGELTPLGRSGSSDNYRLKGARGVIGFISPMSNHFCDRCNRIRITARGKLKTCLFSGNEVDLRGIDTEEELERILVLSVWNKPRGRLFQPALPLEAMSAIGG